jgi:hypothetical protein
MRRSLADIVGWMIRGRLSHTSATMIGSRLYKLPRVRRLNLL